MKFTTLLTVALVSFSSLVVVSPAQAANVEDCNPVVRGCDRREASKVEECKPENRGCGRRDLKVADAVEKDCTPIKRGCGRRDAA